MKISCRKKIALDSRKEAILIPVYKNIRSLRLLSGKKIDDEIQTIISSDYFTFEEKEIKSFYIEVNKKLKKVYLMHTPKELDEYRVYMELGSKFARILRADKIYSFSMLSFEDIYNEKRDFNPTKSFLEGLMFGLYTFDRYLSKKDGFELDEVEVITASSKLKKFIDDSTPEWSALFECINIARDLVNTPASDLTPAIFAQTIQDGAPENISVTVWDEKQIREHNMGMVEAVGKGSANPPRFVQLAYNGAPETDKHIALVGKGVTFDSGGTNLKPSGSIETMKEDMAGAALMYGLTLALAKTGAKVNVRTYIPMVENIIGTCAYRPGDIITSMSGKTVEIWNTDAEGRLILADALYHAVQADPEVVIDAATLTGAMVVALGSECAGFFSNRRFLSKQITDLSYDLAEDVWELPLYEPYAKQIKGKISDLKNMGNMNREGGSIIAALFLREFVANYPWIHLDIAGTSFMKGEHPIFGSNATGFGLRLLYQFIKTHYAGRGA